MGKSLLFVGSFLLYDDIQVVRILPLLYMDELTILIIRGKLYDFTI